MARAAVIPGAAYGLSGFGLGFAFGIVRTLVVAPLVGPFAAVAIETPLMLAACAPLARLCVRRWAVSTPRRALAMGLAAFAALMLCEVLMALILGQTVRVWVSGLARPEGILGLAGQIVFALLPLGFVLAARSRA
jgi:hypothetical protein